ncbi:hypothetical protein AVEN_190235-1 [Araneus ventricosus]|uniref:Transposon Ty3-I Gag-Pol polyprotein n=1 Tax=Araneus ventricosus TaxID=182803 RepID=A0A4Y2TTA4_ARAVE|nr:hypothetical protein AVEN_190235-1 [Araneus ventricosus]
MTQHRINTGDHPPIRQYPRRLPLARKEEVDHLVKKMVDSGIIEESSGLLASPIVLVEKKDGPTRFCVDYRNITERNYEKRQLSPTTNRRHPRCF